MRPSVIKERLSRDEPCLVVCLHLTDPSMHELVSLMGFHGIWLDLEHHAYSVETANAAMRASRVGRTDIMARPAKGEMMRMGRLLEAGAHGILYPRCGSAEEAKQVVHWMKFAPMGRRGFDGGNPDMPYCTMDMGQYVKYANEQTWLAVQLEEPEAVEQADAIAAVDGVDILFFGPGDFSVISGVPGKFDDPGIAKAIEKVAAAARLAGKHWGMPAFNIDWARKLLDMGARLICHGSDLMILRRGFEAIQQQFGAEGFTFANQLTGQSAYGRA